MALKCGDFYTDFRIKKLLALFSAKMLVAWFAAVVSMVVSGGDVALVACPGAEPGFKCQCQGYWHY